MLKTKLYLLKSLSLLALGTIATSIYAASPAANAVKPLPQDGKVHIYVCGTGVPQLYMQEIHKPSCLAVVADNQFLLFDAGEGSIQTLAAMGLPYTKISNIFITHWHSDHFAGLGQVANGSWVDGRNQPLNVYGPYGVKQVVNGLKESYQFDTEFRAIDSQNMLDPSNAMPVPHLIDVIHQDKTVYQKNDIKITAFEVDHRPVYPAVGYRLQYKNCSVTISGDTTVIPSETAEAKNATVFISESLNAHDVKTMADMEKKAGNMTKYALMNEIPKYHSDTLQLAKIAQSAQAKNLVLTHFVPPFVPTVQAKNDFIKGMDQYYKGNIIVANDKDELVLTPNANGDCQLQYVPAT
jgi:ribonuclease Z